MRTLFAGVLAVLLLAAPAHAAGQEGSRRARLLHAAEDDAQGHARHADLGSHPHRQGQAHEREEQPAAALPRAGHGRTTTRPSPARSTSRRARRPRAAGRSSPGRTARSASPTRARRRSPACPRTYDQPLLNRWLKAGYAVVRTDYEGLGTPTHAPVPDRRLRGPRACSTWSAPRASWTARSARRSLIAGHSQGGHAALWAGSLAGSWTPELDVRGTLAFAPASHLGEQAALLGALTTPSPLTGLAAMIVRGDRRRAPGARTSPRCSATARGRCTRRSTRSASATSRRPTRSAASPRPSCSSPARTSPR